MIAIEKRTIECSGITYKVEPFSDSCYDLVSYDNTALEGTVRVINNKLWYCQYSYNHSYTRKWYNPFKKHYKYHNRWQKLESNVVHDFFCLSPLKLEIKNIKKKLEDTDENIQQ